MQKLLIIANWKMNPQTFKEAERLFEAADKNAKGAKNAEIVICPPYVQMSDIRFQMSGKSKNGIKLGSQNCFWERQGAYTGEVSAAMLKDLGCEYVIVGHSERRQYFGETDEIINKKLKAVLSARLKPILCIGESADEKEQIKSILEGHLKGCLEGIKQNQIANIIFAYEPVWAISTSGNEFCAPDYAFSAGLLMRKFLLDRYGKYAGKKPKIIYGGSVDAKEKNAVMYIREAKMDGVLVGAASLKAEEFGKIIKSIGEINQNSNVKSQNHI